MSVDIARSLLGREEAAIQLLLGVAPDESFVLPNGDILHKYPDNPFIKEAVIGRNGRIVRCCYLETIDERRRHIRIKPAHFMFALLTDANGVEYPGMVLDLSECAVRIRLKDRLPFYDRPDLLLDFSYPEDGVMYRIQMIAHICRTAVSEDHHHVALRFNAVHGQDHPLRRYIRCRESEMIHGTKWCPRNGCKCKAEMVDEYKTFPVEINNSVRKAVSPIAIP